MENTLELVQDEVLIGIGKKYNHTGIKKHFAKKQIT